MSKQKILIVDDDNNIAELISLYLTKECYDTKIVNDGEEALHAFEHYNPNLILLDLMLPGIDGYQVCRDVRAKANVPIIMLSAKGEIFDKVLGLELGADDYITKPFGVMELISHVKALLRRTSRMNEDSQLIHEDILMDMDKHAVTVAGQLCALTFKEFELLKYLMLNQGIVLSRDKIMDQVWGFEYEGESRTGDMHIKTLRHKLGDAGKKIRTVRNVGYQLEE